MITFEVEGVSCDHCVTAITEAIQRLDPTARVDVNIPDKTVAIHLTDVPALQLAEAITEAGYDVSEPRDA